MIGGADQETVGGEREAARATLVVVDLDVVGREPRELGVEIALGAQGDARR